MKERINLSLEYEVVEQARKSIKNLSAFVEVCLKNYIKNTEKKASHLEATKEAYKKLYIGASESFIEEKVKEQEQRLKDYESMEEIANYNCWEVE